MPTIFHHSATCFIFLVGFGVVQCLAEKEPMVARNSEDLSLVWEKYEFNTGTGNREELIVTNISMHEDSILPSIGTNRQFLHANNTNYLADARNRTLSLYKLDERTGLTENKVELKTDGEILTFKLVDLANIGSIESSSIVAILCVESTRDISLRWYEFSGNNFTEFWQWPIKKRVHRLEILRHNGEHKLLLLDEAQIYFGKVYSPIEVYGFRIGYENTRSEFWLCQRLYVPKTFNIVACPVYESSILAVQTDNRILLYDLTNDNMNGPSFQQFQNISSHDLQNFVCFQSGYIQYFAISGPEAGLYTFFENEFSFDTNSEKFFNGFADIAWIQEVQLDTYRDESLLLVQLKNSSVIALAWQGTGYVQTILPNQVFDNFDLSKVTAIPKFGFVFGNTFVRIDTELRDLAHPIHDKMERMLKTKVLLEEVLEKQESIVNKSETHINKNYQNQSVVTGFWNLSKVEAENVTITDNVNYRSVSIGFTELSVEDINSDVDACLEKLKTYERKLNEIHQILNNTFASNMTEADFASDLEISGNFVIEGVLRVKNLTFGSLNGMSLSDIRNNYADHGNSTVLGGQKIFPAVRAKNFTFSSLNGIPLTDILFDPEEKDYSSIDFAKIKQLIVDGHLFVPILNDVHWDTLMQGIVWKNKPAVIPGDVVVDGEVVADWVQLDFLNGVKYPQDYVSINDPNFIEVTGSKSFDYLQISNRYDIDAINDVPINDYVILDEDEVLDKKITFENLRIDGNCEIDGIITGKEFNYSLLHEKLLNESNIITSDVTFTNLTIVGKVFVQDSINGSSWYDFEDLLQRSDEIAEITGHKTFLGDVQIETPINITSNKINGHLLQEFVTLDTEQEFLNLERILANVTFGRITDASLKNLEDYLKSNANNNSSRQCLDRELVFLEPPIIDQLFFNTLNNISGEYFSRKLNETFSQAHFENLTVKTLLAREITPKTINGINLPNFESRRITPSTVQTLTGNLMIDQLTANSLTTELINGMPLKPLHEWLDQFGSLQSAIFSGMVPLQNLTVTKSIEVRSINGKPVAEMYPAERIGTVVFEEDVFIRNLTVLGLINNHSFSDFVSDAILKTDTDIVVSGHKVFEAINCRELEMFKLNGHLLENVLDPEKDQLFTGPVTVKGSVTVENSFHVDGKINDIFFRDLTDRFKSLGNDSYEFHGDLQFPNDVTIKNLEVNGSIQEIHFNRFMESIILKNQEKVSLSGSMTFEDPVTFNGSIIISERLNDINIKRFYDNAVFIDKPFSVKAKLVFRDDLRIQKDLVVNSEFETRTITGVDLNELQASAMYINRPTYITAPMTFENVIFNSGFEVKEWNNVDMSLLIPLKTDQPITVDVLKCVNVFVKHCEIMGKINDHTLNAIYIDTFLLTDNQRITGNITFHGNVKVRHNFDVNTLNGINPKQIISLHDDETLTGHFTFQKPVTLNGSLRLINGYLNGVDPARWEALAIASTSQIKQIVSANWTVHGDVRFQKDVNGDGFLDGMPIGELSDILKKRNTEMEYQLENAKMDHKSMCSDLNDLKHFAENQIYRFNTFEYLQILDFDRNISGIHYFESNNLDYLLIGYDTCHMDAFVYTGTEFALVASVSDFGYVEKWMTLRYNNETYFLALGKQACGKSAGNLWKIEDDEFKHVKDFGNVTDARKINSNTFLILIDQKIEKRSIPQIYGRSFGDFQFCPVHQDNMKFVKNSERILVSSHDKIYEYNEENLNHTSWVNQFGSSEIVSCHAGIYNKEILIYYGRNVSTDYIFVCSNNMSQKKVLQTIKTHNPKSFVVLNFESDVETLLIFAENDRSLQIYEYKGVQEFVYRDNIQINIDQLYSFKIRKYPNLAKRHCLAVIRKNRLTILEAKMYGEKLDMDTSSCTVN